MLYVFFFKLKTAYELRISDWSSDLCSSDLVACDLRVATPSARFGIPAAKLGLMVDHWTIERLALLAGAGPARAMLVAAETYGGEDAERLGLVQRMGDLDDALRWADEIPALDPLPIARPKPPLNRLEMPVGQGSGTDGRAATAKATQ